jgi:hypothetical protein
LNDAAFGELANSFLCASIIQRKIGNFDRAAWSSIHAAWFCDDSNDIEASKKCRRTAIDLIKLAQENGQSIGEQEGAEVAMLVDLLRRNRQFSDALALLENESDEEYDDIIITILQYQKKLISNLDAGCHTVSEALGGNDYH